MPSLGPHAVEGMAFEAPFLLRDVWRYGLCEAPDYCSSDAPSEDCKLVCRGCEDEVFTKEQIETYTSWWTFIQGGTQWYQNASQDVDQIKEQLVREVHMRRLRSNSSYMHVLHVHAHARCFTIVFADLLAPSLSCTRTHTPLGFL